jgi:hypothetical protein
MKTDTVFSYETAKKMVHRLLTEKRIVRKHHRLLLVEPMTEKELAEAIGVEPSNLIKLVSPVGYYEIVTNEISNALRNLYFITKWKLGADYKEPKGK